MRTAVGKVRRTSLAYMHRCTEHHARFGAVMFAPPAGRIVSISGVCNRTHTPSVLGVRVRGRARIPRGIDGRPARTINAFAGMHVAEGETPQTLSCPRNRRGVRATIASSERRVGVPWEVQGTTRSGKPMLCQGVHQRRLGCREVAVNDRTRLVRCACPAPIQNALLGGRTERVRTRA